MGRRTGSRYLRILRGGNNTARDQLISYLKGERQVTYAGRQGSRPAPNFVYVDPFALPLQTGKKLEEKVTSTTFATVSSYFSGFVSDTHTAADIVVLDRSISPRAVVTIGRSAAGTSQTSKLTGLRYTSYGGNGVSVPFGKGTGTNEDTVAEVFKIIRTRVKTANAGNMVSLVPGLDIA
jgi:hypothetical protein